MIRNLLCASPLLLLAACGGMPPSLTGDAALNGAGEGATFAAVAARPVWVGRNEDRRANACTNRVAVRGDSANVRWSPSNSGPAKAAVAGDVLACDVEGDWTGVIFPGPGETLDYCNLNRRIGGPTEYQGPCRQGWVLTAELTDG
jgi:hypothetical protein